MNRNETPARQQKKSADWSDPSECAGRSQRQSVKRAGKQDHSANPTHSGGVEEGWQARSRSGGPPGEPEQSDGMNEVITHCRFPKRGGLTLRQGIVQGMSAECAQRHAEQTRKPGGEK